MELKKMSKEFEGILRTLPPDEQAIISDLADELIAALRARHSGKTPLMFGRVQALELHAKIGIWIAAASPQPQKTAENAAPEAAA